MRDLRLNPITGDLDLPRGPDGIRRAGLTAPGGDAVRQRLDLRLGIGQGEYVLDTRRGMPFLAQVFVKGIGRRVTEGLYRRAITTCPGVASLDRFAFAVGADRVGRVSFSATPVGDTTPVVMTDFVPAGV